MRYPDIIVPTEGDGSTFALVGNGYYRGHRLAEVHYRIAAGLVDIGIFFALWLPAAYLMKFYLNHIESRLPYQLWLPSPVQLLMVGLLPIAVSFFNVIFMQSRTGQSLGKMLLGLVTVSPQVDPMNMAVNYFAAPSGLKLAVRWCFHAADAFLLIGVWVVAFSSRRESLADKACNTWSYARMTSVPSDSTRASSGPGTGDTHDRADLPSRRAALAAGARGPVLPQAP